MRREASKRAYHANLEVSRSRRREYSGLTSAERETRARGRRRAQEDATRQADLEFEATQERERTRLEPALVQVRRAQEERWLREALERERLRKERFLKRTLSLIFRGRRSTWIKRQGGSEGTFLALEEWLERAGRLTCEATGFPLSLRPNILHDLWGPSPDRIDVDLRTYVDNSRVVPLGLNLWRSCCSTAVALEAWLRPRWCEVPTIADMPHHHRRRRTMPLVSARRRHSEAPCMSTAEFLAAPARCTVTGLPLRLDGPAYDPLAPSMDLYDGVLRLTCSGYNQLQNSHRQEEALRFFEEMRTWLESRPTEATLARAGRQLSAGIRADPRGA